MAKGNMLLGYSRGKVGDLVFKRVNGKQVTVPRVRVISNPKTDAQVINRIAFSTASKTAQQLRGIVDHSFQGIPYGAASVNHFVSQLSKELSVAFMNGLSSTSLVKPFGTAPVLPMAASGVGSGAPILVSRGDLQGYEYAISDDVNFGIIMAGQSDIIEVSALSEWQQRFGVPYTDQTTIICSHAEELDYISDEELFYGVTFEVMRFNFRTDVDPSTSPFVATATNAWRLNPAVIDMERSDPRALNIDWIFQAQRVMIGMGWDDDSAEFTKDIFNRPIGTMAGAAVICSRFENNVWRRSTARMFLAPEHSDAASYKEDLGWNDAESVLTLARPSENVRESEYLNKKKE